MFGRKGVKRVEQVESLPEEQEATGFSLEELGSAYAQAIGLAAHNSDADQSTIAEDQPLANSEDATSEPMLEAPDATETDGVAVTPESILEAMLFLGSNNNRPLSLDKITACFREITATEVDAAVDTLNRLYQEHQRAMEIVREPGGYRMQLASDMHLVRDKFYAKVKETQLTQSAIDCLALVAYQPGLTREALEKQWNQPASSMLSMLVRRGLLRIEKSQADDLKSEAKYFTTDRFLDIIGLDSLEDLPLAEDLN